MKCEKKRWKMYAEKLLSRTSFRKIILHADIFTKNGKTQIVLIYLSQ